MRVFSAEINPRGFGQTLIDDHHPPRILAAVDCAGSVWDRAYSDHGRDGGCADLRNAVAAVSEEGIWSARRRATKKFNHRQDEVLHLARRLLEKGQIIFETR